MTENTEFFETGGQTVKVKIIEPVETESKPGFYAIIPANVRYDKRLIPNAKLLYGEITALTNKTGYCWAENRYFAELYNVSKKSISRWIGQLKEYGYISCDLKYRTGSKEIEHRYIRLCLGGMEENRGGPIDKKVKDNITLINNTINNTSNRERRTRHLDHILLTDSDYKILTDKYGEEKITSYIRKIDYYLTQNPKKHYKDFKKTIINWIEKDYERDAGKNDNQTPMPKSLRDLGEKAFRFDDVFGNRIG